MPNWKLARAGKRQTMIKGFMLGILMGLAAVSVLLVARRAELKERRALEDTIAILRQEHAPVTRIVYLPTPTPTATPPTSPESPGEPGLAAQVGAPPAGAADQDPRQPVAAVEDVAREDSRAESSDSLDQVYRTQQDQPRRTALESRANEAILKTATEYTNIIDVDCRGSVCKADITHRDEQDFQSFTANLIAKRQLEDATIISNRNGDTSGSFHSTVYFAAREN